MVCGGAGLLDVKTVKSTVKCYSSRPGLLASPQKRTSETQPEYQHQHVSAHGLLRPQVSAKFSDFSETPSRLQGSCDSVHLGMFRP